VNKASKGYGSLGKLVKPGTYFEPEEPDHADYGSFDPTEDADGTQFSSITKLFARIT